jgi:hypothetical protein
MVQLPNVSMNKAGNSFAPILERITISKTPPDLITFGAPVIIAFTVSIPALTGGFDNIQSNSKPETDSYK